MDDKSQIIFDHVYSRKMTKNDSVFVFSADDIKKLVTVWEKYLHWVLSENGMFSGPWSYRSRIEGRNIKKPADWIIQNIEILYF